MNNSFSAATVVLLRPLLVQVSVKMMNQSLDGCSCWRDCCDSFPVICYYYYLAQYLVHIVQVELLIPCVTLGSMISSSEYNNKQITLLLSTANFERTVLDHYGLHPVLGSVAYQLFTVVWSWVDPLSMDGI